MIINAMTQAKYFNFLKNAIQLYILMKILYIPLFYVPTTCETSESLSEFVFMKYKYYYRK